VRQFEASSDFPCEPQVVFDFLIRPANMLRLAPPELQIRLVDGPEVVQLGSRITLEARHFGIRQRLALEVVEFDSDRLLTDEQREGPFGFYRHRRQIEPQGDGSRMMEVVEFRPPGGMMGMLLSADRLYRYIADLHEHRTQALRRLLEGEMGARQP